MHRQLSTSSNSSQWMPDTAISASGMSICLQFFLPHFSYNHISLSFPFNAVYRKYITCMCLSGVVNCIKKIGMQTGLKYLMLLPMCRCGSGCRRFEETSAFILKEWSNLRGLFAPRGWRHYVPSQPRKPLAKRHGVISQKTWILSNTSGKKSQIP
jgi:hypothetical protein